MGAVFLAEDPTLQRRVALKVPSVVEMKPAHIERFWREARAAAALQHSNICPVFEVGDVLGVPYMTMAFIEGEPLGARLKREAPLPIRPTVLLVRKLALALEYAHRRGVVHRDLKPANIMINEHGEPLIMDFGLARRMNAEQPRLTHQGTVIGTPAYMSPEQVAGDTERMGPACDVYSLGVVLYELLSGELPFSGDTLAVLSQIANTPPSPPSLRRPDVDPALDAICLKAMAKAPQDRFCICW